VLAQDRRLSTAAPVSSRGTPILGFAAQP